MATVLVEDREVVTDGSEIFCLQPNDFVSFEGVDRNVDRSQYSPVDPANH